MNSNTYNTSHHQSLSLKDFQIIQWNINGFHRNYDKLQLIMQEHSASVLCLQETHEKNISPNIKGFSTISKSHDGFTAKEGVAILVKDEYIYREISINSTLQVVAVQLNVPMKVTICNIYLPPKNTFSHSSIENIIDQLPQPFILCGDINSHHSFWDTKIDSKGRIIADIIEKYNLYVMNNGDATHYSTLGTFTAPDVTFCTPEVSINFQWRVDDQDPHDHFPIIISSNRQTINTERRPKWNVKHANWTEYQNQLENICEIEYSSNNEGVSKLNSIIIKAAKASIPRTSSICRRVMVPWWNKTVAEAVKNRRKTWKRYKCNKTIQNRQDFSRSRALARRTILYYKKECWHVYLESIDLRNGIYCVWDKIHKINGSVGSQGLKSIRHNGTLITETIDIVNVMADTLENVYSNSCYSDETIAYRTLEETKVLPESNTENHPINVPFTMQELEIALDKKCGQSTGPNDIHIEMLKQLPHNMKRELLKLYNNIWMTGKMPDIWKHAYNIPLKKPGKDSTVAINLRYIALTCCDGKLLERMVNRRLNWYLESHKVYGKNQSGFRCERSCMDNLTTFEADIRIAILQQKISLAVFVDLEKAFDRAWHDLIIKELIRVGISGNMLAYIKDFLCNRTFQVLLNNTLSNAKNQINGVPQGSVISVTLFNILMATINEINAQPVKVLMYADDIIAYTSDKDQDNLESNMQYFLDSLDDWSKRTGLTISKNKTKCMMFHPTRIPKEKPELTISDELLEYVSEHKVLGMIIDNKLSWKSHINMLKRKADNQNRILRVLCGQRWGSDAKTLLYLHNALTVSKSTYGQQIYNSANEMHLKKLEAANNTGIRQAIGAFRTSPIDAIHYEAGSSSLEIKRKSAIAKLGIKILGKNDHPLNKLIKNNSFGRQFNISKCVKPFYINAINILTEMGIYEPSQSRKTTKHPPWLANNIKINTTLTEQKIKPVSGLEFHVNEILADIHKPYIMYTDGSKDGDITAFGVYSNNQQYSQRLPNHTSIFMAELKGIEHAIESTKELYLRNIVIFTDSLSSVLKLRKPSIIDDPTVINIYDIAAATNNRYHIVWIPSHIGITGNEIADKLANRGRSLPIQMDLINSNDAKNTVMQSIRGLSLAKFPKPSLSFIDTEYCRETKSKLSRLRIGHTNLTHSHIFTKEAKPRCTFCNDILSIKHLIAVCPGLQHERNLHNINESNPFTNKNDINNLIIF